MIRDRRDSAPAARRTAWGQARIGTRQYPALAVALPAGVVLAGTLALLAVWAGAAGPRLLTGAAVFALCLAGPSIALVYLLVVDRSTLRGAVQRPEESIESQWYKTAASGALNDVVLLAGMGAMLTTFLDTDIDDNLVLALVVLAAALSCSLRYVRARRSS